MRSAPNAGETEKHLNGTEREVSPQPIFGVKDEQAGLPKKSKRRHKEAQVLNNQVGQQADIVHQVCRRASLAPLLARAHGQGTSTNVSCT